MHDADDVRVCAFCGAEDDGPYRWSQKVQAWFCEDGEPEQSDGSEVRCREESGEGFDSPRPGLRPESAPPESARNDGSDDK